jgi:asparagine synthase (glutamine-hydrolysing)
MTGHDLTLRLEQRADAMVLDVRSSPHRWTLPDDRVLVVIAGPHTFSSDALVAWIDDGCPDPAPVRQGFAAVLVDQQSGQATMAVGARSEVALYWSLDQSTLCVSSHLLPLLDLQPSPALDEGGMARYLWAVDLPDKTMYRGIDRVPAGHVATWRAGAPVLTRRWFWPQRVERYAGADFPGSLREVIGEAVAASLPPYGDVATQLSGGLDSTIVTALAARQLQPHGRAVHALSHVVSRHNWPDWMSDAADDAPFVQAVVEAVPGLQPHEFDSAGHSPLAGLRRLIALGGYPFLNPLNTPWMLDLDSWVRAHEVQLMLTGLHGSVGYSIARNTQYRKAIARGDVALVLRDARARRSRGDSRRHISATIVGDVFPRTMRTVLGLLRRSDQGMSLHAPPFLTHLEPAEAASRSAMVLDDSWWTASVLSDPPAQSVTQRPVMGAWVSDPLGDAEVVRMLFAAPPSAWLGDGTSRALARRAMAGLVPDVVRLREPRGIQAADVGVAVTARQLEYAEALAEVEASPLARSFIDVGSLRAAMSAGVPAQGREAWAWQLVEGRALGFGLFLTWFENYAATRKSTR